MSYLYRDNSPPQGGSADPSDTLRANQIDHKQLPYWRYLEDYRTQEGLLPPSHQLVVRHKHIQHGARLWVAEGLYSAHSMWPVVQPHQFSYLLPSRASRDRHHLSHYLRGLVQGALVVEVGGTEVDLNLGRVLRQRTTEIT